MAKSLFQLYIDPDQLEFVIHQSEKTGWSRAEVVRDLIRKEMEKNSPEPKTTQKKLNEKTENIQQDGGEVLNVKEVDRV